MWNPTIETASREQLRSLQDERLRRQLAYVYERSSFYRTMLDSVGVEPCDIRGVDDLHKLPLTTKQQLRDNQDASQPYGAHVSAAGDEIVWIATTSGTSGAPLVLPRTAADIETWTDLNARAFTTAGLGRGDIFQNILGYQWMASGLALHSGAQRAGVTVINAGLGNTSRQMWSLETLGVTALHATPSYLLHLGRKIADAGMSKELHLTTLIGGGEVGMASPATKDRLRELFPTVRRVSDVGGITDIGTMIWAECEEGAGGHIAEDAVVWEVIDSSTGQCVPDGEVGELVLTDVVSSGAPLLRYRVRDLVRVDTSPCPCGRTSARFVGGILGRSDDMITVRAANVYPAAVDDIVRSVPGLGAPEYQVIVERVGDLDVMTLRVELPESTGEVARAEIRSALAERFRLAIGSKVEIQIEAVGTLPRFAYKAMRLIDKRAGRTEEDAWRVAAEQQV
ncbi:phenylacetate--CoA ligase family protein [Saccharopolyspora tripterygii]